MMAEDFVPTYLEALHSLLDMIDKKDTHGAIIVLSAVVCSMLHHDGFATDQKMADFYAVARAIEAQKN